MEAALETIGIMVTAVYSSLLVCDSRAESSLSCAMSEALSELGSLLSGFFAQIRYVVLVK
ncbi:hypothetical protein JOE39_003906 [Pseudomonas sp. PvP100]|nr:hypothetical protein [Pseudomonas sp. PvP007]MBP1119654.1 hypothetical protein [Pseudomonas sp. PvP028]MBP1195927.1 hypothetical protein [Pseudomonas sp. PvP100]